jgi:tetratricopeptide (TPR) repeat protein
VVYVALGENLGTRTELRGEVLDYTGKELRLRTPGGAEMAFPSQRVLQVETDRCAPHAAGDKLFAQRRYAEAEEEYRRASGEEPRRWVRRLLLAQRIWCLKNLGNYEVAGQFFAVLMTEDPETIYFDCLPLAWVPEEPSPNLQRRAEQWLVSDQPYLALLGASHLLATSRRADAVQRLGTLAYGADTRVAALAKAQLWRTELTSVRESTLRNWQAAVEAMPEPLRAGPYFMVATALAQQHQSEAAALYYLRVPLLYPNEGRLAARCLVEAAKHLERLNQTTEAAHLYREAIRDFAGMGEAAHAEARLQDLLRRQGP